MLSNATSPAVPLPKDLLSRRISGAILAPFTGRARLRATIAENNFQDLTIASGMSKSSILDILYDVPHIYWS
jgi:hypothetical protein